MGTKAKLPIRRDIEMKRGMDWNWTIRLLENDGVTAINTTGYTATFTIKAPGGAVYDTLVIDNGITHTPVNGQFNIGRAYTTIDGYEFSSAEYDLIFVNTLSKHWCAFYGNIKVMP